MTQAATDTTTTHGTGFDQVVASTMRMGWAVRRLDPPELLQVSAGFLRLFGLSPDRTDLTLAEALAMVHADDRAAATRALHASGAIARAGETELRIVRPDGEVRWIRAVSDPVPADVPAAAPAPGGADLSRTGPQMVTVVEDVTARKDAEAAVRWARQQAETANAAKGEFLSRMSLEIRTPLNAVLGFAQILELEVSTPSQRSAVDRIIQGGTHLLDLVSDVLDITGIDTGTLSLSIEPVDVLEVLTETIDLMRPVAAAHHIPIRFRPGRAAAAEYVQTDRKRLRQVLLNLLSNAVKYNQPSGRVDVSCALTHDDQIRIAVTDTGKGIRPEDMPRLFEPFDRLGEQSSDIDGAGIGLALSQRLLGLLDGTLEVVSSYGYGSTFTVTLNLIDPPPTDAMALLPAVHSTLLYIEDNPLNAELVKRIVAHRPNWQMYHAATATLGLELAATVSPTVILLDLHLPDLNGDEVLKALRANPDTAVIPVAVLSADANQIQIQRLLKAGAQLYMTKPLNVAEVLAFIDSHSDEPAP